MNKYFEQDSDFGVLFYLLRSNSNTCPKHSAVSEMSVSGSNFTLKLESRKKEDRCMKYHDAYLQ